MKYPFLRRAIALALALFLVLAMVPPMAVPAAAADETANGPTLSIKASVNNWPVVVGDEVTLEAVWSNGENPADEPTGVRYSWTCTDTKGAVLELSEEAGRSITVTAKGPGSAAITLTASKVIDGELTQLDTKTLENFSVTSLEIMLNKVPTGAEAQLVVGQGEATLKAEWSNGRPAGVKEEDITYQWTCDEDTTAVTWPSGDLNTDSVTVKAADTGATATAKVTVTASWTVGDGEPTTTTCKLTINVIAPQLAGIEIFIGNKVTTDSANLVIGGTARLEAKWANDQKPIGFTPTYEWKITSGSEVVTLDKTSGNPVNVTAKVLAADEIPEDPVEITVTAKWGDGDVQTATFKCTLKITAVAAESIKLDQETLTLAVDGTAKLTATVLPENASVKDVTWRSDKPDIATVDQDGVVTGKSVGGPVTITATSGDVKATCTVYVTAGAPTIAISGGSTIVFTSKNPAWNLTAIPSNLPEGANTQIRWTVSYFESGREKYTKLPQFRDANGNPQTTGYGETVTIVSNGAGEFFFTVEAVVDGKTVASATKRVTISGIVLTGTMLDDEGNLKIYVGGSTTLTVEAFGDANDTTTSVEWGSSDSSIVSVMNNNGNLNAWGVGKAVITATKGDYSVYCTVEVGEDESVIAGPYRRYNGKAISASNPLKFMDKNTALDIGLCANLNSISREKTKAMNGVESPLKYITNLKVSPSQGTLYNNYSTESDTGIGVGNNHQFAEKASGSILSLDRVYFVPKPGFVGTAEITFNGVAVSGQNFSGIIRVEVGADLSGSGSDAYRISYRARAGEAVSFQSDDFNLYSQGKTGRSYNTVTFNLPKTNEGILYYNYVGGSGNPVSTTMQFTPSGRYTIDDVCFVPNAAFEGEVTISFRIVDTAGEVTNGTLTVEVFSPGSDGDLSVVTVSGERGRPVTLQGELFNAACRDTIGDTLNFVTFGLPARTEGTLYYNYRSDGTYDSRVTEGTRYYYSGVPGLGSVSFVPASNNAGQVAIPYTGYSVKGASFSGTLYISLEETNRTVIHYSAVKNSTVSFSAADFYNAALYEKGVSVTYVRFGSYSTGLGRLYYSRPDSTTRGSVSTSTQCYYSPSSSQVGLGRVYFEAGDTAGTVTIPYTAYCGTGNSQQTFTGYVVIQVGASAPEDIRYSCNTGDLVWLAASSVNAACSAVMSGNLSYIEITSVPSAKEGHLYLNYSGFGTGKAVEPGDRFYRVGSPGISQLIFVPFGRFAGQAEITYVGYTADRQEQVSGRILVNVTKSTFSRYFEDMGSYTWAADAVDYLYRNETVKGVGGDRYNPSGSITRGDFALMLVRAYGLTANGSASFSDVPANSYYADAIRIASLLGIVSGYNGKFRPKDPLTRQDAMVMIYNTLKAEGKTTTNGLTADLSGYSDEGEISSYAKEAVGSLVLMGVVEGDSNGSLRPQSKLKRAEAAVLLHTIMTL